MLYILVGLLVALSLVGGATAVQTGNSRESHIWLEAQRHTPLLWMVDGCALAIFLGIGLFGAAFAGFQEQTQQLSEEHGLQLNKLIERTEELTQLNAEYAERITGLEAEASAREEVFEDEVRRLTQQTLHALEGQVEANARQLDAVNLAMQYQRAELRELRQSFRNTDLSLPPAQIAGALPAEIPSGINKALPPHDAPDPGDEPQVYYVEPTEVKESTLIDQTVNAGSTLILGVDFEVLPAAPEKEEGDDRKSV
ncbi:MAG TPA: hypothetical protein VKU00_00855 [Chthonomonadaceae bacterium]|nr:hypothetical protein [Chthonomonadaceae bacterium]